VNFAAITLCVASQRVFIVVSVYFFLDSVPKLLDTPSYIVFPCLSSSDRVDITLSLSVLRESSVIDFESGKITKIFRILIKINPYYLLVLHIKFHYAVHSILNHFYAEHLDSNVEFFWVVMPCRITTFQFTSHWRCRQHGILKRWYLTRHYTASQPRRTRMQLHSREDLKSRIFMLIFQVRLLRPA
jgi:hypothetical protein